MGRIWSIYKTFSGDKSPRSQELKVFDNALLALLMMLEFRGCFIKIGSYGSFDTAYGVDSISDNPSLAGFVHVHHSIPMIQVSCSEFVSFRLDTSKKFMRCVINENRVYWAVMSSVSIIQLFSGMPSQQ